MIQNCGCSITRVVACLFPRFVHGKEKKRYGLRAIVPILFVALILAVSGHECYGFRLAGTPRISVSPASLNFGNVKLGGTSSSKTVTIKNTGTTDLAVSSIAFTGTNASEFSQTNNCATVASGGSCVVNATFSPTLTGSAKAAMTIASNDPTKATVNVNLLGTSPPPRISVSPASLNFGSVKLGGTSSSKTVTIKNTGTTDLVVRSIAVTGANASEFSQTNNCATVASGGSCVVNATFSPTLTGSAKAAMTIASNDPTKATVNVNLLGTSPPPRISVSPASVNFGSVKLGGTSPSKTVTIKNTGTTDLVVRSIAVTGTNASEFSQTNNCATVASGGSCVVNATFSPTLTGSAKAAMTIASNDPTKATLSVGLSGTSPAPSSKIILDGAIDNLTTYPDPVDITYIRKDGTTITDKAFPGQVVVLASTSASMNEMATLITGNGGVVAVQIPNIGFYVASINESALDAFLSAMHASSIVVDAFPNGFVTGRRGVSRTRFATSVAASADANSLIQTIDVSEVIDSCGSLLHKDAVGYVAKTNGMDVRINDYTVYHPSTTGAGTAWKSVVGALIDNLNHAQQDNKPVIINISLGAETDDEVHNYNSYGYTAWILDAVARKYPALMKNAVIFVAGSDKSLNETNTFKTLFATDFPDSPVWNNLYFVESQEGTGAGGCGIGYADIGPSNDMNVLSAPGCNIQVSDACKASGTSFATPAIANLIAQTYEGTNESVNVTIIAKHLMKYQKNNQGRLPSVAQLVSLAKGGAAIYPAGASFDGAGGSGSITLTAPGAWTAESKASWISVTSGSNGTGNGTITYTVAANSSGVEQTGTIAIAGKTFSLTFTVTQSAIVGVTGTWSGTLTKPGANYTGCAAETVLFNLYLTENAARSISGSTSNSRTITSGSRTDHSVTVTLMTNWGSRGPYTWTWDGNKTITGSMAYFCYNLETYAIQFEGTETFSVTRD